MNRSLAQAFIFLNNLASNFKEKMVNPCQVPVQLIYSNLMAKNKLLPAMLNLQKMVQEMHSVMIELSQNLQLDDTNTKILHFLQKEESPYLDEVQQICLKFECSIKPVAD
jgi:DNA-binding Xre family transcriptional regulator